MQRSIVPAFAALGLVGVLVLAWWQASLAVVAGHEGPMVGQWISLNDVSWQRASTGWLGVANQHQPAADRSFGGGPLSIAGQTFDRGIGTVPLSEIVYRLDGGYSRFSASIGVDDATAPAAAGVRFLLFVDEVLNYQSDELHPGDRPVAIDVNLHGAETLRLAVVAVGESGVPLYADWADPRLLRPILGTPLADRGWEGRVRVDRSGRTARIAQEESGLARRGADLLAELERQIGSAGRADVQVGVEPDSAWAVLGNDDLVVALGLRDGRQGQLVLLDRRTRRLVFDRISPALATGRSSEPAYRLALDAGAGHASAEAIALDPFGRGEQIVADFPLSDGQGVVGVRIALFAGQPYFLYELSASGAVAGDDVRFHFLETAAGEVVLGDGTQYVTDFSRLRHAVVQDDGLLRRETVSGGKPVFLWSEPTGRGLLLAAIDETRGPTRFAVRREAGRVAGTMRLAAGLRREATGADEVRSPRLYVELPASVDLRRSHANFRRIMAALYPPAPLPSWLKYQWISWYAFNVNIDEEALRGQIDYIAENLADLGPWHILIDAGWYVAEGREGAEWRNVDREKFPSGLRALVDYAHSRDVRVVGYFSTPYLDSRQRRGDWLGLRQIIEAHRDWLIELGGDESHESFAFDFANPAVRAYWREVINDLLVEYDMDGIKVDGLGNAEGAELTPGKVDTFGLVDIVADQALDIYRFIHHEATARKPSAYVQAGWLTPILANPYAHTFWYGDDYPAFSNPYPFPGLREHVDYAVIQHQLLGQRSNMGNLYDGPNGSTINRWWLGAGLALGTHLSLSFDLTALSPEALSTYRSFLVHYNAFAGETRYGPGLRPDTFATTVQGTTYLGLLNRGDRPRTIAAPLADLGIDPSLRYTAYDVEDGRFSTVEGSLAADLPARSFRLVVLRREPGVLWTNSSFTVRSLANELEIAVRGPANIAGSLALAAPEPSVVLIDGRPLRLITSGDGSRYGYWYEAAAGVLHLQYPHRLPHRIRVVYR